MEFSDHDQHSDEQDGFSSNDSQANLSDEDSSSEDQGVSSDDDQGRSSEDEGGDSSDDEGQGSSFDDDEDQGSSDDDDDQSSSFDDDGEDQDSSDDDDQGNSSDDNDEEQGGSSDNEGNSSGDNDHGDYSSSDDSSTLYVLPGFVSKNKKEVWDALPYTSSSRGRRSQANIMRQKPGPTRFAIRECDSISSSFQLFFRSSLLDEIQKWSNKEGQSIYKDKWVEVSIQELKKFIGTLILIGVYKSKNENVAQLWSRSDGRPLFNKIMSRRRFEQIVKVLRFDDAASRRMNRTPDRLQPIKDCFESWNTFLRDAYIPGECMTVDEQLVTFRGRCPFRQYIKSKPGRYGIKIWAICDSKSSYAWKMEIYAGKKSGSREVNQGERVVLSLTEEIEKSGRNVTCDNFFTSLSLAKKLLTKKLTMVGTIRRNKGELPPDFVNPKNREVYSTHFGFQKKAMILSYCPKQGKIVTLLSTMHSQPDIDHSSEKKKPEVILSYNSTKGGVDTMDQMLRCYSVKRMTRRWPMVIFYNMVDVSALNAYIIWVSLNPTYFTRSRKRRQFLIALGKELAGIQEDCLILETDVDLQEPPKKKRRCFLCDTKKDRKTKTTCKKCNKNVCGEHSRVFCRKCIPI